MVARVLARAAASLALLLLVAGCGGGGGGSAPPPIPPTAAAPTSPQAAELAVSSYRLGSGDRVRVTVFRHEDLSGEFALDGAGNFAMPLIGAVQVGGQTTGQAARAIAETIALV